MSEFSAFLQLGFHHIADIEAFDHLLFIITLCAVYEWKEWKKVLVLITAFTIGHTTTLILTAFDVLQLPPAIVEVLIPATILLTALHNVWAQKATGSVFSRAVSVNYLLALFFGLIHGMGFANYFRNLFGQAESIVRPLFAFNAGIELGQVMIVVVFFLVYFFLSKIFTIRPRDWNLFLSGAGAGVAITLIIGQLI
ncbi:MAG TPA: HupE/UreJ family protein [Bacteroidetes bacterium]|nr:HupE/UreJ family protein [Bacteroidota bacterium]